MFRQSVCKALNIARGNDPRESLLFQQWLSRPCSATPPARDQLLDMPAGENQVRVSQKYAASTSNAQLAELDCAKDGVMQQMNCF